MTIACKKGTLSGPPSLNGSWTEVASDLTTNSDRSLFIDNDKITYHIWDGVEKKITYIKGTFRTEGDKFITNFTEIEVRQQNDQLISKTPVNTSYFNNATYVLTKSKLTLTTTGSPSNITGPSTIVFVKILEE